MTSRVLLRRTLVVPMLLAAIAACSDDDNGNGPGNGSFTLGAPATTQVTVQTGSATTVTIPVTISGGMRPVTLIADSVPAGIRVGFEPSTITSGTTVVTMAVSANPGSAPTSGTVKIIARAQGMQDQVARVQVTSTAPASYTVRNNTTAAAPVVIKRGAGNTVTITIDRSGGFTGPVDIFADGLPPGFSAAPVTNVTGNTATLTLNTTNLATASGAGSFTVRVTNPSLGDRTTTVNYNVTPEYTLTNSASTAATAVQIQRGQSGTATITINRDTYQGPVTLTASGLPTGITVPTVSNVAGNTATITISTAANAVADTGSFLITGTASGYQNQTTRVRFRVLAEPGVQIASAAKTVQQGGPDSVYVTVNREGGFTGAVTVTLTNLPTGVTASAVTSDAGTTVAVPLTIAPDAAVGTSNITVTVTGANIATKTVTPALTVRSGQLTSGTAITAADARPRGSRLHWFITVPAGKTQLQVTFTGGTGDGDLYLFNPSGTNVCTQENGGNAETCTIANPAAGVYRIRVEVWDPYAGATLRATVTP